MGGNPLKYTDPQGLLNPALAVCAAWPVGTGICVATGAVIAWGAWSSNQHPGGGTSGVPEQSWPTPPGPNGPPTSGGSSTGFPELSWPTYPPGPVQPPTGGDEGKKKQCDAAYAAQIKICQMTNGPRARSLCYANAAKVYADCLKSCY